MRVNKLTWMKGVFDLLMLRCNTELSKKYRENSRVAGQYQTVWHISNWSLRRRRKWVQHRRNIEQNNARPHTRDPKITENIKLDKWLNKTKMPNEPSHLNRWKPKRENLEHGQKEKLLYLQGIKGKN